MSESTDDAPLATNSEVVSAPEDGRSPSIADADDVEVVAQPPEPARHDSALPTSRKLAPPPKPKRDSSSPTSAPPAETPSGPAAPRPSSPSVAFQEASSREAISAALLAGESLRAIGDALAQEPGGFSKAEIGSGRPAVPRPRSQPSINPPPGAGLTRSVLDSAEARSSEAQPMRDKMPTTPDAPASAGFPRSTKPSSVAPQRIITVGGPSDKPTPPRPAPLPAQKSPPPPPLALDLEPRASAPEPIATAEPPAVALPALSDPVVSVEAPPPVLEVPPPPPFIIAAAAEASTSSADDGAISVEVHVDEAPADIPITTEFEEDTPTLPLAVEGLGAVLAPLAPPPIPDEPTPPPPLALAEDLSADTDEPDAAPVEELSREDSPSVPPDEPAPAAGSSAPAAAAAPPPAPSTRADAKPPPPPKRAPAPAVVEPPVETEKKKSKQKRPWWEELFSEDFVRANWKVSDEQIKREVTFVEESLGVAPGGVVLDLGCGSGQHAVELASRGYGVVGYDLSLYQLALAADNAQERSQKINFLQGDMREMAFEEMFDGIFCWNTSFGYFEEDKNYSVAERTFRALRPGGMFLIDVMNRDFVAAHTPSSVWFEGDSCVCMDDAVIDYFTSRLRVKRSVILDDGRTRECTYSVRLYSFHELGKLLHEVGFRVTEVSGHPATPGVFLGQASPRILMLAQRP